MAYDLSQLKTTKAQHPPRILIYGPPGLGKTSLATEFPDPIILDIEQGVPMGVEIPTFGAVESFDQVMDAMKALYTGEHKFRTLIIDTLDRLEPLVWEGVCAKNGWKSIEDPGYGKGYVAAVEYPQSLACPPSILFNSCERSGGRLGWLGLACLWWPQFLALVLNLAVRPINSRQHRNQSDVSSSVRIAVNSSIASRWIPHTAM